MNKCFICFVHPLCCTVLNLLNIKCDRDRNFYKMNSTKGMPLVKDEVDLLINLIEANKVVTNKATNATNNQLKEVAWKNITNSFNACVSSCPRRPDQLKLKWENLKKAARKRSTKIRMNQLKTGGGKPDYIPPDDTLDRVASILGTTCEGYSVPVGGDAEIIMEQDNTYPAPSKAEVVVTEVINGGGSDGGDGANMVAGDIMGVGDIIAETPKPKKYFFSTPSGSNIEKQKRKLHSEDIKVRIERNKAIAEYYNVKKKKLELDTIFRELECQKLKLEIENMNK